MVLFDLMKRELKLINDLIDETSENLKSYDSLPHRTLECRTRPGGALDYYAVSRENGKKKTDPLGQADSKDVIAYKRQRYLQLKLSILLNDKKAIEQFLKKFKDHSYHSVCMKLPQAYKGLNSGSYESDELRNLSPSFGQIPEDVYKDPRFQELLNWAAADYKRNNFPLPENPNIARDGTPMRSKGECMWLDDILFEGLPCRVEPEIMMKGKSGQWHKLCPDFVFKCFDGTYIFVEHFGDWANQEYAESNLRKIQAYLDCGITLGDNLVVTSDNVDHCTNELMIMESIQKIESRMFA